MLALKVYSYDREDSSLRSFLTEEKLTGPDIVINSHAGFIAFMQDSANYTISSKDAGETSNVVIHGIPADVLAPVRIGKGGNEPFNPLVHGSVSFEFINLRKTYESMVSFDFIDPDLLNEINLQRRVVYKWLSGNGSISLDITFKSSEVWRWHETIKQLIVDVELGGKKPHENLIAIFHDTWFIAYFYDIDKLVRDIKSIESNDEIALLQIKDKLLPFYDNPFEKLEAPARKYFVTADIRKVDPNYHLPYYTTNLVHRMVLTRQNFEKHQSHVFNLFAQGYYDFTQ